MKLLKLRIDGVTLFKDKRLELDFIATIAFLAMKKVMSPTCSRYRWGLRSIPKM